MATVVETNPRAAETMENFKKALNLLPATQRIAFAELFKAHSYAGYGNLAKHMIYTDLPELTSGKKAKK